MSNEQGGHVLFCSSPDKTCSNPWFGAKFCPSRLIRVVSDLKLRRLQIAEASQATCTLYVWKSLFSSWFKGFPKVVCGTHPTSTPQKNFIFCNFFSWGGQRSCLAPEKPPWNRSILWMLLKGTSEMDNWTSLHLLADKWMVISTKVGICTIRCLENITCLLSKHVAFSIKDLESDDLPTTSIGMQRKKKSVFSYIKSLKINNCSLVNNKHLCVKLYIRKRINNKIVCNMLFLPWAATKSYTLSI